MILVVFVLNALVSSWFISTFIIIIVKFPSFHAKLVIKKSMMRPMFRYVFIWRFYTFILKLPQTVTFFVYVIQPYSIKTANCSGL